MENSKYNIWKDPNDELPRISEEPYGIIVLTSYNVIYKYFISDDYDIRTMGKVVIKWCYEEDLIKQAGGK